ncbi:MAG: hypothetical protein GX483_05775 [Actinomycetaceae bacterium]|nr:hypothetical protein [Actinomycetaceae bacterium]
MNTPRENTHPENSQEQDYEVAAPDAAPIFEEDSVSEEAETLNEADVEEDLETAEVSETDDAEETVVVAEPEQVEEPAEESETATDADVVEEVAVEEVTTEEATEESVEVAVEEPETSQDADTSEETDVVSEEDDLEVAEVSEADDAEESVVVAEPEQVKEPAEESETATDADVVEEVAVEEVTTEEAAEESVEVAVEEPETPEDVETSQEADTVAEEDDLETVEDPEADDAEETVVVEEPEQSEDSELVDEPEPVDEPEAVEDSEPVDEAESETVAEADVVEEAVAEEVAAEEPETPEEETAQETDTVSEEDNREAAEVSEADDAEEPAELEELEETPEPAEPTEPEDPEEPTEVPELEAETDLEETSAEPETEPEAENDEETDVVGVITGEDEWGEQTETAQDGEATEEKPKKKRRWPLRLALSILLLGGAYVGLAFFLSDKIPANTYISGVAVGGMTPEQAAEVLDENLSPRLNETRVVDVENPDAGTDSIDPRALGLELDYATTLDHLTGFSLDPQRLWAHLGGEIREEAVLLGDEDAVEAEVMRLAEVFALDATDAEIILEEASVSVSPAVEGVSLDEAAAEKTIYNGWFETDGDLTLPSVVVVPMLTTEDAEDFVAEQVAPLLDGPISINVREALIELNPEDTAALLEIRISDFRPRLVIDDETLENIVIEGSEGILTPAIDARIEIIGGAPQIFPSTPGEGVDMDVLVTDMRALGQTTSRTIEASVMELQPELTTEEAEELGIVEIVSTISTPLTSDNVRTTNLIVGSSKVTNTIVLPGEQFDLQTALGPITPERGFVSSGVLVEGFPSNAMGGGLSQLATNMFNIGYRAGLVDIAHQPHSQYYSRYPMGLESTMWADQIFVTWENNTPYGVLVESYVSGGYLVSNLWSTKYYDVEVWQSAPYNYRAPTTKYNSAPDCVPSSYSSSGFTVNVGRKVTLDGVVVENSSYSWTYEPTPAVVCNPEDLNPPSEE